MLSQMCVCLTRTPTECRNCTYSISSHLALMFFNLEKSIAFEMMSHCGFNFHFLNN